MLHLLALAVALAGLVPDAIERSVQERMGEVRVSVIEMSGSRIPDSGSRVPDPGFRIPVLVATPEPGSRLGRPIRFIVYENGARVGSVVAKLEVTGLAVRSSRALLRGEELGADAVELVDVELKDMLVDRLPTQKEIVGAQARRNIRPGEVLTNAAVIVPPVIKSGDEVRVSMSTGAIQLTSQGRASGSGHVGDVIRVLMPASRRGLKARVTGPGSVEIVR
jgi:flagella basal body P-ring formation protein FlgA